MSELRKLININFLCNWWQRIKNKDDIGKIWDNQNIYKRRMQLIVVSVSGPRGLAPTSKMLRALVSRWLMQEGTQWRRVYPGSGQWGRTSSREGSTVLSCTGVLVVGGTSLSERGRELPSLWSWASANESLCVNVFERACPRAEGSGSFFYRPRRRELHV